MAWRKRNYSGVPPLEPRPTVRVLRDEEELAAATERAAEAQRRLEARLETRARHDAEGRVPTAESEVLRWRDALKQKRTMPPPHSPAA